MARSTMFKQMVRRFTPAFRARGTVLQKFADKLGLVYFGSVHQHDDEHDAIRGFTASLTHKDTHYAVGTYNGYNIRLVDRFDTMRLAGNANHEQFWTILEFELDSARTPHLFFVPTGREAGEYGHIYSTHATMQPLNAMLFHNRSPEFHGRFQILATPSHAQRVAETFTSPVIAHIASRFWPHGIEITNGKLLVYITEHRLTKTVLESAVSSGLWLAETIDAIEEED